MIMLHLSGYILIGSVARAIKSLPEKCRPGREFIYNSACTAFSGICLGDHHCFDAIRSGFLAGKLPELARLSLACVDSAAGARVGILQRSVLCLFSPANFLPAYFDNWHCGLEAVRMEGAPFALDRPG